MWYVKSGGGLATAQKKKNEKKKGKIRQIRLIM